MFLFPIPLLPFLGYHLDGNSLTVLYIVAAIVSIPFTLIAIFMNSLRTYIIDLFLTRFINVADDNLVMTLLPIN
ncbi:MAG: hypothetical protein ACRD97_07280 [Nitrososphaeraceae archaeon]